ncbi:MAG: hypothetical protein V4629_03230 [Pseudomonadota bacterium]
MRQDQQQDFFKFVQPKFKTYKVDYSPDALLTWWEMLEEYPFELVCAALIQALKKVTWGTLNPSHVIECMGISDGHPEPQTAWAKIPKQEMDCEYLTDEMSRAWGIAKDALDRGDLIQGHMIFIEAYKQELKVARITGKRPRWFLSQPTGLNREESASVIRDKTIEARREGLIGTDLVNKNLRLAGTKNNGDETYFLNDLKQFPDGLKYLPPPIDEGLAKKNRSRYASIIANLRNPLPRDRTEEIRKAQEQQDRYRDMDLGPQL